MTYEHASMIAEIYRKMHYSVTIVAEDASCDIYKLIIRNEKGELLDESAVQPPEDSI